jgi:hypothetical protein
MVIFVGGLGLNVSMTYFAASKQISLGKLALFSLLWPFAVALLSVGCTLFFINKPLRLTLLVFLLPTILPRFFTPRTILLRLTF